MRFWNTILLTLLLSGFAMAQNEGVDGLANIAALGSGEGMFRSFDNRSKGLEGSPFLFDSFVKATITMVGDWQVVSDRTNFDVLQQELVVKKDNRELAVSQSMIKGFSLHHEERTVHFQKVYHQNGKWLYLEMLVDDKVSLLKEHRKIIKAPTNTGAYSTGSTNSTLEVVEKLYVVTSDNKDLREFKNKKTFLSYFEKEKSELEKFIKEERINFKVEADLIKLVKHLASIHG